MSAVIIDGKAVAGGVREQIAQDVARMRDAGEAPPLLAVVLCNDNPASAIYVRNKERAAERAGMSFRLHTPPLDSSTESLVQLVHAINSDPGVDGMLVQLPLPAQVDAEAVGDAIAPEKDADGFHPLNFGHLAEGRGATVVPGTPLGCMELLRAYDIPVGGARAVVIGRSVIVGRPMATLLLNADATVTVCHSRTRDLAAVCREADILISAMGRPRMVDAGFVKPGAAVIDVGTTPEDGTVAGDVDRASVEPVAGWLSPVPGGVGPMTVAMLLRNTLALAAARRSAVAAPG
ncbi:MAG: bifunctional 5,10-methylenetetrahydrofolate dehydrogenase/5,10-methenyltetrahydrofolate cyclohydrolase [Candidatus Dormibacteraeota bacterium]|nr:bifunctional 5,10-methylenetetrahydrofolate dehydrogenase/5,10-methenyltetrahydrofolate cyclohydrolase [Candidatus Dormibacteraeota bacterium]